MARTKKNNVKPSISLIDLNLDEMIEAAENEVKAVERSAYGFVLPLSDSDALAEKVLTILETRVIPFATLEKIAIQAIGPDEGESVDAVAAKRKSFVDGLFAAIRRGANHKGMKVTAAYKPEGLVSDHLRMRKRESKADAE